jgi:hypothetical protein
MEAAADRVNSIALFGGDQGEPLPPPDNFAVFLADAKKRADGVRGARDEFQDLDPVFIRRGGGFKVPVQVWLFERRQV